MDSMTRRQWIRSSSLLSGGATLATMPFAKLFNENDIKTPDEPATIQEIHIINLSHHDYGYTDLPSSVWDFQVNNIRLAMRYIEETKDYPSEARFKWTCEGLWGVERFWHEASQKERNQFDKYVADGSIEVTFMPGNMTCLAGSYAWEKELDRLSYFQKKYQPLVALQNDVNGQPWGLVDSLTSRNVKYVVMGANGYRGGNPLPAPSFFWWEGSENNKILMYNGQSYIFGYFYFNGSEWRRGPVPHRYDVWFNPPTGNEIFSTTDEGLAKSYQILQGQLGELKRQGYPHSILEVSFTNMWTGDNDIPCRQLSEFVKTWNEKGMRPKLIFSTPSMFLEKMSKQSLEKIPTLKGEWVDWWADGIAGAPYEVALLQSAQRRNKDIGNALKYFSVSSSSIDKQIEGLNHKLVFASEHTWGAYDSAAHPYSARALGNHAEKFDYFYRADEDSRRIQAEIIKESRYYSPLSETKCLEVINPGTDVRSGWAEVSAGALRIKANGVQDLQTGLFLPFEQTLASQWRPAAGASQTPPVIPNDIWPFFPDQYRFHLEKMQPGERRRFELTYEQNPHMDPVTSSHFFEPVIDSKTGQIKNIIYRPLNKYIFDDQDGESPGQLIIERPQGKYSRNRIDARNLRKDGISYNPPALREHQKTNSYYALRYQSVWEESFAKRIEQQWDIFDNIPRIEISTTIWMKEQLDPLAVYMNFPFAINNPSVFYDSLGNLVEVGKDQLPNTCGLYNTVQNGVSYKGSDINIALTTLDAPIGIFEEIVTGQMRTVFTPKNAHFYSLLCQNYWITNFPVLQPAKLVFRHIIECGTPAKQLFPLQGTALWGYPCPDN